MDERLNPIVERYRTQGGSVIGVLQDIHEIFGYLPEEELKEVSREIDVPLSTLYGLATFYSSFRLEPMGRKHICVCVGTACHVKGAPFVVDTIERELGVEAGTTSADGEYTFDTVNCLGACALAPLVTVNEEYHGKTDQKSVVKIIDSFKAQ